MDRPSVVWPRASFRHVAAPFVAPAFCPDGWPQGIDFLRLFYRFGGMPVSQINVSHLSFRYDTSFDPIFEDVSFTLDTDWRLGLIGRNGRGKTTLLQLLLGRYPYQGAITASVDFEYFPFDVEEPSHETLAVMKSCIAPYREWELQMERLLDDGSEAALSEYGTVLEQYLSADGYTIDSRIEEELGRLGMPGELLHRPFDTLSHGERTRVLLAALFLRPGCFLLIDEPTNHLDGPGRDAVADYLAGKKGFILVSHDRELLDRATDHIMAINRSDIEVQQGNYSVWQENKDRRDAFELAENERLKKDIARLGAAAKQRAGWSDALESTKIGHRPPDQVPPDRGFIGHKSAKLMKRAKVIERRAQQAVEEKSALLKNLETADELKISPLDWRNRRLLEVSGLSIDYGSGPLFEPLSFAVEPGERVALCGSNGCGKSSILHLLLGEDIPHEGGVLLSSGLEISFLPQDTSSLRGGLREFAQRREIDESLFKAILRKLDFSRVQFEKDIAEFSGGQKKKVLLAASLCERAHLYVWDEPLNFVDILSRVQIEELILRSGPAMLFVEHDRRFTDRIATKIVQLKRLPVDTISPRFVV